ncbi:uncharacterized protein LOC119405109 [Rhipicephalus sanguineus]|uniref:uncharacterized protein LOC119405109 n=1 Tax=Rhipicephalus sanguineus TaxID=34632 RepID=UPI001893903B|nr:uncharacterized protein LOC119405109 [Rhipicephalus sanguineus]
MQTRTSPPAPTKTLTMSSFQLPANADEDILERKIDEVRGNLQSLNISYCVVAQPAITVSLLSSVRNLKTLSCIGCPLRVSRLLDRLLMPLQSVTHLEFSLLHDKNYVKEELLNIADVAIIHDSRGTNIRKMYVEVADDDNMKVLRSFLQYCPVVMDLHVHAIRYTCFDFGTMPCLPNVENQRKLAAFTFTCEASYQTQSEPAQPLDLQRCIAIHGNVVFRGRTKDFSCVLLRDLVMSPKPLPLLEPTFLVAVDGPDVGWQLLNAGLRHSWGELRSLCIALFSRTPLETVYPAVHGRSDAILRDFFARLCNLVELNVSSFHFGDGIDFTELLATPALQRLRALALPPCGLRRRGAVRRLAIALGDIEDLDIRVNLDGRHRSCTLCDQELIIEPADASAFRIGSGRLTISNVPSLASLDFLECLRVSHVRFIDVSDKPRFDFAALAKVLRSNDTLRFLVVQFRYAAFGEQCFQTSLRPAKALQRLCLLTQSELVSEAAEGIVQSLAHQLTSLFYVHMHYVKRGTLGETSVTWIQLPEGDAKGQSRRGKVVQGVPCIMCSTQTFVALAKPRIHKYLWLVPEQ